MRTKTTIAACIQIQVGDIAATAYPQPSPRGRPPARSAARATIVWAMDRRFPRATFGLALALCMLACAPAANAASRHPTVAAPHGTAAKRHKRPAKRHKSTPATTALLGGVNIPGVGFGATAAALEDAVAQAHALHARVVRAEVPWSALEPLEAEHTEASTLALTDLLVSDAAADGMRVIMDVDSTPCWASSAPLALLASCNPFGDDDAHAWPPANPAAYAAFVAFLAQRYGTRLAAIEVWNEPDQSNEQYFAGPNKAALYAALLRTAYPAIKAANPSVPVLGGAFVGANGEFLRVLYADGIKGYYDGLAVHFYTLTLAAVRYTREVQLANGDTTPMWLDEFGWSSCWPQESIEQEQDCVTPQVQASNLSNTMRALARSPYVAAAVSFKLEDSSAEDFGVLSAGGTRKPAFAAVAGALASPLGAISPITLRLVRHGGQVVASGSAPVGDYMRLEVLRGKHLRYWTVFTLNRFNDYSITLPAAVSVRGLNVRVYQYWSGMASAVEKKI